MRPICPRYQDVFSDCIMTAAMHDFTKALWLSSPIEMRLFKSQCRNISRISNQFRKIEFWFIPPKQPIGMVISENYIKKSPSALHLDNLRKVRKFTKKIQFLFMKLVKISNDFKETVRARKISC